MHRRKFLASVAGLVAGARLVSAPSTQPLFTISLAQWSLHRAFGRKQPATADPLDFAKIAKTQFDIDAVEYVNLFYKDAVKKPGLGNDLKKRADDHGVKSVLIMCDGEGNLGDPDNSKRLHRRREPSQMARLGTNARLPLHPRQRRFGQK